MKNKGFTLIELLVVIVLFGLSAAWYTNGYFQQREKESLLATISSVRSYLDYIRQNSVSILVPNNAIDFQGYGFTTNSYNNTITRVYFSGLVRINEKSFDLNRFKHITLISPSNNTTVYFEKGSGFLFNSAGEPTSITVKLKNNLINSCASLEINQQGRITTNDKVDCQE